MNVRTNLLLPKDLVDAVDEFAGPRGRSRYIAEVLARQVKLDKQKLAFEETFGALTTADYPHWSSADSVVEWVRDRRSEQTDAGREVPDVPDPRLDVRDRPPARRQRRPRSLAPDVRGG